MTHASAGGTVAALLRVCGAGRKTPLRTPIMAKKNKKQEVESPHAELIERLHEARDLLIECVANANEVIAEERERIEEALEKYNEVLDEARPIIVKDKVLNLPEDIDEPEFDEVEKLEEAARDEVVATGEAEPEDDDDEAEEKAESDKN